MAQAWQYVKRNGSLRISKSSYESASSKLPQFGPVVGDITCAQRRVVGHWPNHGFI